jgi:hypothetical protein
MTALAAARQRLELYVAECILRREDLDVLKLRYLEHELERATLHQASAGPF